MKLWIILPIAGVLLAYGELASSAPPITQARPALTTTPSSTPDTATATATSTAPTVTATQTTATTPTVTATATMTATYPMPAWHGVTAPASDVFTSIAGAASNDLWIAGPGFYHWDGTIWHAVPNPTPTTTTNYTSNLAVGASNSVWATTNYGAGNAVLHWDGSAWNLLSLSASGSPRQPNAYVENYSDATAFDANNAFFTHFYGSVPGGTSSVVHCTTQGCNTIYSDTDNRLFGVSALNTGDLWAVGIVCPASSFPCSNPPSYAVHIAGGKGIPAVVPNINHLYDVAALADDNVWAVGPNGILHWNGTTWSQVSAPSGATKIVAVSPTDIWATGGTVTEHWDGSTWTAVPGQHSTSTYGIQPFGPADAWTVGSISSGSSSIPSIERYAVLPTFSDVPAGSTFAPYVEWLAGHALIGGYPCGGDAPCDAYTRPYYRPAASVSRAQTVKIVTGAAGWALLNPASATFADVVPGSTFYGYIETAAAHGIITGYACGGPGEPCDGQQRPYFRPGAPVSRGQMSKIIALARDYTLPNPASPTFADVAVGSTFYPYVEAVAAQSIVSGYACGTVPDEPCDAQHRPYFRPSAGASRGQVSKFVTLAYGGP